MKYRVQNTELQSILFDSYTSQQLENIVSMLNQNGVLDMRPLESGLYPAAGAGDHQNYSGYEFVWVRDNIFLAYSYLLRNEIESSLRIIKAIMRFYTENIRRFREIIVDPNVADIVQQRPHIRFDGKTLHELSIKWPHAQNDALGYFVWITCKTLQCRELALDRSTSDLLAHFVAYFYRIGFWADADSGHWEEGRKIQASSIGVVTASLLKIKELADSEEILYESIRQFECVCGEGYLHRAIDCGKRALSDILPWESRGMGASREFDSAILFLCYPLRVVSDDMEFRIIAGVENQLLGEYGIRRYIDDTFWGPDYKAIVEEEGRTSPIEDDSSRQSIHVDGREAQWCIFDSILSAIYANRFYRNGQESDLRKQAFYFNRAIGQITSKSTNFPWKCPELYYWENGKYVPGDVTPLYWSQSNLQIAIYYMRRSCTIV